LASLPHLKGRGIKRRKRGGIKERRGEYVNILMNILSNSNIIYLIHTCQVKSDNYE